MEQLSSKGLSRVTLATEAKALRRFLQYAHEQGWCRRDLVQGYSPLVCIGRKTCQPVRRGPM
jgi:site-specific recombinase XerC